jgi:hypothetical protein
MGYTHFNRLSSTNGYSIGAAGSESEVIDSSGNITAADIAVTGAYSSSAGNTVGQACLSVTSTDGGTDWITAPFAATITAYAALTVSSGTGRVIAVVHGSAGDNAVAMPTQGVTGTIGKVVTFTASAVPTCTAQEVMRVVQATCATAQVSAVTVVFTPL